MIKLLKTIIIFFLILISNNFINADVIISENPNTSVITDTSIKVEVNVSNGGGGVLNLKGEISDKVEVGGTFITIKSTDEKIVSGPTSTISFTFGSLLPGHDYSIRVVDSINNSPYAFSVNYSTTGTGQMSENYKAYLDSKLTVSDTTAKIKYSVITDGDPKNIALKYSTTDKDLNETEYGPVGEIAGIVGTDTAPAEAEFNLTNLKPDTFYVFWVVDKDTDIKISIKNSFHTLQLGAEPYSVYAGLGTGDCPDGKYCYLAPLGKNTSIDTDGESIADYLKYIFKFGIGLAGLLAVIMLIIGGVKYMGSDSFFNKEEARSSMSNALIGLLIALSSFLILNTLNPDLVNLKLNINKEEITLDWQEAISESSYSQITGLSTLSKSEYDKLIEQLSAAQNIDKCIVKAIVQKESGYDPKIVGHDEENGRIGKKTFLNSGKTYKNNIIDKQKPKNDDKDISNQTGLGIDWRFSHGIGLMQITFFPSNYFGGNYTALDANKNIVPTRDDVPEITPTLAFIPGNNILAGIKIFKKNATNCINDLPKAFSAYNGGSCPSTATSYGIDVNSLYNQCKTQ